MVSVHGADIFGLNSQIMRKVKRFVLKYSDEVCVNSFATMEACRDVYDRQYQLAPMGVDTAKFRPSDKSTRLISKYQLGDFTILFVGRLADVKGVKYLIEAASKLNSQGLDFKVLIAGDGKQKQALQQQVEASSLEDKVIFTGWISQDELSEYYSVSDVFVGPSLSEAQGIVFLEALATGTPVIASDVGGIPTLISHGENGYLTKPGASDDIAEYIAKLINHPEELDRLRQNARKKVIDDFAWEVIADKYTMVLTGGVK